MSRVCDEMDWTGMGMDWTELGILWDMTLCVLIDLATG
jgi:hypothetical protein